jgi:alkylhydroperoxidase family enzyme
MDRWSDLRALLRSVQRAPGTLTRSLREAIFARAARPHEEPLPTLPERLREYTDTVARHAYRVTDAQVAALRAEGYSEEQIFEATVTASVGAAQRRLAAGLRALYGASRDPFSTHEDA